jgi:hypothetical protein
MYLAFENCFSTMERERERERRKGKEKGKGERGKLLNKD